MKILISAKLFLPAAAKSSFAACKVLKSSSIYWLQKLFTSIFI
jgi:hypothetical protein